MTNPYVSKFHKRPIHPRGTYGNLSKLEEELDEVREALEQGQIFMAMIELSDLIGAIGGLAEKHGYSLEDLIQFSEKVREIRKQENKI